MKGDATQNCYSLSEITLKLEQTYIYLIVTYHFLNRNAVLMCCCNVLCRCAHVLVCGVGMLASWKPGQNRPRGSRRRPNTMLQMELMYCKSTHVVAMIAAH